MAATLGEDHVLEHRSQLLTGHPQQKLRAQEPILDLEVVAVQHDTLMAVGRPRNYKPGRSGRLVPRTCRCSPRRFPRPQPGRGTPLILQEPLMSRRVIGVGKGLMHLFQRRRCGGEGQLVVIQPGLHVQVGFYPVLITLTLSADDRLILDL
jgi:hypothetical protein